MPGKVDPKVGNGALSLGAAAAFACVNLPVFALTLAVMVHLPRYFAGHLGLGLGVVGSAFAIVRIIDIPLDPLLGLVMDRTRSRFGRYRLWTVLGVPVVMLGVYMLIQPPEHVVTQAYLIGWLLVMYLGLSILLLAHSSWAAVLAPTYNQRSRIFGLIAAVGVVGGALALAAPIVSDQLGRTEPQGVQAMGWLIIAMTPLAVLAAVWKTPERVGQDQHRTFRPRDYWMLLTRPNMVRLMGADLLVRLGPLWMGALYLFFFKDSRGFTTTQATLLLLIYVLAGFAGAPATASLARKIGKHQTLMLIAVIYSLLLASVMILPRGAFAVFAPLMFIVGALASGFDVSIRALTADIGDELRLESGKEWMGLLYALTNATTKVAGAFSIYLTFNVLEAVGYSPALAAANTPGAIHGLEWAFLSGPIVCILAGAACFIGYGLNARRHADIRRQLDERDALLN